MPHAISVTFLRDPTVPLSVTFYATQFGVFDYSHRPLYNTPGGDAVEEIAISKFKATCLAVLEKVRKTRKPVLVTRFG